MYFIFLNLLPGLESIHVSAQCSEKNVTFLTKMALNMFRMLHCGSMNVRSLSKSGSQIAQIVRCNSHRADITRTNRNLYARQYPTVLVQPDGSTINIRYYEPRKIIRLPLDLTQVSEEVKQARIDSRKPRKKIIVEEEIEDTYEPDQYIDLWESK
ncbi:large ribosomal subunit protein mL55-like [Tubulanus polymorphus]|uniref:large ribosomal subunit protein mL55-like n=1 Tax=Tubulanus polymorphus TaxID=672921 RepID=UPI003DA2FCB4